MLKYVDCRVVFKEVPNEITLAVNISGCPCKCGGCHSIYLLTDIGEELNEGSINNLIERHTNITCFSFMGGDIDPQRVSELASYIKNTKPHLKIAWYSGRDYLSTLIDINNFDFIKIGQYKSDYGGLDSETTNQRFYKINKETSEMLDVTHLFWSNNK